MQNACIIGAAGVSGAAEVACEELESGASSICGAINACACPPECDTEAAALGLCEFNKGLDTPCSALNCPERTTDAAAETTDAADGETTETPPTVAGECQTEDTAMETCMDTAGLGGGAKVVCVSLPMQVSHRA